MKSREFIPKYLFASDYKPNVMLAQFMIEMQNVVGALREQADTIANHGVKILSGFHHAPTLAENGTWSFFADFTNADIEPEALAAELRTLGSVLSVSCRDTKDGFITDTMHFPILFGKERMIFVRAAILSAMIERINSIFGLESKPAQVILRQLGEAGGQRVFESTKAVLGLISSERMSQGHSTLLYPDYWPLSARTIRS